MVQTLQAEMGDLKSIFKTYFDEGGQPLESTTGELLTVSTKQSYQYDIDSVKDILKIAGIADKALRLNTSALDKMVNSSNIDDEIRDKLISARINIIESSTVTIQKPDKSNNN
jgi:hypothetical protein